MEGFDRRKFLKGSSVAAGLAGAMTIVPGALPALAKQTTKATSGSSTKAQEAALAESVHTDQPIIAHIRDVKRGQIDLFVGTQHFSIEDRALTSKIVNAAG